MKQARYASASHDITLQHTASHCNTLHHSATRARFIKSSIWVCITRHHTATPVQHLCNTLHTPRHGSLPVCVAACCNASHWCCSALRITEPPSGGTPENLIKFWCQHLITRSGEFTAAHCNTLQHTATHYNTGSLHHVLKR